jgi:NAD(P)-dependent dehydrogenase (short-subunit alcohol dehydrogenase family)
MVHYGVSKAALQGLSRGLAKVLAGSGVTVNTILPGPTRTEGAIAFIAGMAQRRNAGSPRRRWRPCSSPKTVRRA